jgi:hypothetical protein
MATAAKFVQPILMFLAYLVLLDVDVVPIKFHQFLLTNFAAVAMEINKGGILNFFLFLSSNFMKHSL